MLFFLSLFLNLTVGRFKEKFLCIKKICLLMLISSFINIAGCGSSIKIHHLIWSINYRCRACRCWCEWSGDCGTCKSSLTSKHFVCSWSIIEVSTAKSFYEPSIERCPSVEIERKSMKNVPSDQFEMYAQFPKVIGHFSFKTGLLHITQKNHSILTDVCWW